MVKIFYIFSFIFLAALTAIPQSIKDLEVQRKKTEEEIKVATRLLGDTEKQRNKTVNNLAILKRQIELRSKLVNDINHQIEALEKEKEKNSFYLQGLNKDLLNLKREYSKLIQFAWRNKSNYNILMFILASNDFNEAYRRIKFYQQFIKFREKQGNEIVRTQKMILHEIENIETIKTKLEIAKRERRTEIEKLQSDQLKFNNVVQELRKKERQLINEIENRRKAFEAINKAITDLIAEEAKRARERKQEIRDARYLKLSDGFAGNKGKLPWPTKIGMIVSEFGEHSHPIIKGLKVKNNGVDISTEPNARVFSVFEGEVKKIVSIPGANTAILIRHGEYLSVYTNLHKVFVKIGDQVKPQQEIGEIYTDSNGKAILNFQIWKENNLQNPQTWILP